MHPTLTADDVLARLSTEERAAIERFRNEVRALLGPRLRDLRIFGSKARGDDHDESDIDLLILIQDADNETMGRVAELAHSISPFMAPHTFDFEAYHRPSHRASGFYKELRKESVRL